MPGKHIFANPACITASIGIYGGKADFSELYDKIDADFQMPPQPELTVEYIDQPAPF